MQTEHMTDLTEPILNPEPVTQTGNRSYRCGVFVTAGVLALLILLQAWNTTVSAPNNSVEYPAVLTVTSGMGAANVAAVAKEAGLVRSKTVLFMLLTKRYDPTQIYAGTYTINEPLDVFELAQTIASGAVDDTSIRLTIPEGLRAVDIAALTGTTLTNFDQDTYLTLALPYEGKLYPETYFVAEDTTPETLLQTQLETFEAVIAPLQNDIDKSGKTLEEVLILASIVEREANSPESMKMVAGIFENRREIGMALQADATIAYILDTPLSELKAGELAENLRTIDSPYNTYTHNELPPTPIANPGTDAIMAVLNPIPSDYFYYLTDDNGDFYYARTLDEHNQNIARYLR